VSMKKKSSLPKMKAMAKGGIDSVWFEETVPRMQDGAGQPVSLAQAAKAVKALADLWRTAEFDCGPQDYDFMVKQYARDSELLDELEDRLDLPEVTRPRHEPTLALAESKKIIERKPTVKCPHCGEQTGIGGAASFDAILLARKTCEHCRLEFLIVDDVPMTEEQHERRASSKPS
jgi:hypothetical protein